MRSLTKKRLVATPLIVACCLAALVVGPIVSPAQASSTTCSIPVGSGVVTPSGGNTLTLGTSTEAVAHMSCVSLDLAVYSATINAVILYADGTICGYTRSWGESATAGMALDVDFALDCATSYYDSRVNQQQTLKVWGTTSNGVNTGVKYYPIG